MFGGGRDYQGGVSGGYALASLAQDVILSDAFSPDFAPLFSRHLLTTSCGMAYNLAP
jgi:hypothetical protein